MKKSMGAAFIIPLFSLILSSCGKPTEPGVRFQSPPVELRARYFGGSGDDSLIAKGGEIITMIGGTGNPELDSTTLDGSFQTDPAVITMVGGCASLEEITPVDPDALLPIEPLLVRP